MPNFVRDKFRMRPLGGASERGPQSEWRERSMCEIAVSRPF